MSRAWRYTVQWHQFFNNNIITPYLLPLPTLQRKPICYLSPKRTKTWLRAFLPWRPFDLRSFPSFQRMIKYITSRDPLDPSATEWTPRRTGTDPPPRTYVPANDCIPTDPTNGQRCCRRCRRRQNQSIIASYHGWQYKTHQCYPPIVPLNHHSLG